MAFVTSSFSSPVFSSPVRGSSKLCAVRAVKSPVGRVARTPSVTGIRMDLTTQRDVPDSDVLGLGKNVPSSLYALASAPAFLLGCWGVYQSNFAQQLAPDTVNPQFILASLLVPISWGLHVAAYIQKENGK